MLIIFKKEKEEEEQEQEEYAGLEDDRMYTNVCTRFLYYNSQNCFLLVIIFIIIVIHIFCFFTFLLWRCYKYILFIAGLILWIHIDNIH